MRNQDILLPLLAIYAAILPSSGVQGERAQVLRRRQQDNTENHVTAGDAQNQVDNAENHVLVAAPDNHDFVTPVDAQNQEDNAENHVLMVAAPDNHVVVTPGDAQNQEDNAENHVLVAEPDNHDGGTLPYPTPYPTTAGDAQNLGSSISGGHQVVGLDGVFMVYLSIGKDGGKFFCGGTLITQKYVLTAAHCMFDKDKNLISADAVTAIIGRHDLKDKSVGERFNVHELIPFDEYDPVKSTTDFDFLILMLDGQSKYPPVSLDLSPIDTEGTDTNILSVTTMGWGYTSNGSGKSSSLLYADLDLWDYKPCMLAMPAGVRAPRDETMLCANEADGQPGAGICAGDSGGPLLHKISGDQIGINSFSYSENPGRDDCGSPQIPNVFSRISYAAEWIHHYLMMAEEDNSM